jgi:hypothetical protein
VWCVEVVLLRNPVSVDSDTATFPDDLDDGLAHLDEVVT